MSISHAEALKLLGEIDGVTLSIESDGTATVHVEIAGKMIPVISEFHCDGGITDHHVTRLGIMEAIDHAPNRA